MKDLETLISTLEQLRGIATNLNGLIEYVMNGDKTDEMKYVFGVNCLPETAYEQGLVIIDNTRDRKVYLQKFFGDEYSYNKVIDRILEYENTNIIKYGKKYKMGIEEYKKILEKVYKGRRENL